jgi:membrane-bound lytic murein transglycosylase A
MHLLSLLGAAAGRTRQSGRPGPWHGLAASTLALLLGGCAAPAQAPAPPGQTPSVAPSAAAAVDTPLMPAAPEQTPMADAGVRWARADYAELPGWTDDRALELWPALLRGCARPMPPWREFCARAALESPADDAAVRRFLQAWLQPWRLHSADGRAEGLATGYFEPELDAVRQRREGFGVPLHAPPADLGSRRPHFSRQELDTLPQAQASLSGRELAWISDPVDLMLLQIQGSGRLRLIEPDGRVMRMRVAFAGHNGQPYRSPGRWLVDQGELRVDSVSWGTIRAWAFQHPQRIPSLLWSNPRVVYFRLESLPDPSQGPRGAQGVPLTPMRSVAVDARAVPYGSPMWISTTDPLAQAPLQRLVMAQDTGGAILGAVRIDLFTGWGDQALVLASRLKQPLRAWVLWPREQPPPPFAPSPGASSARQPG